MFKKNDRVCLSESNKFPDVENFGNGIVLRSSKGVICVLLDDGKTTFEGPAALFVQCGAPFPKNLRPGFCVGDTVEFEVQGKHCQGIAVAVSPTRATVLTDGGRTKFTGDPRNFKTSKTQIRPEKNVGPIAAYSISRYRASEGRDFPIIQCKILRDGAPVIRAYDSGDSCQFELQPLTIDARLAIQSFLSAVENWAQHAGFHDLESPEGYWIDWMANYRKFGLSAKDYLNDV